jgi:MFS family permease
VWSIFRRPDVVVLFLSSSAIFVLLYGAYVTFVPFLMAGRFDSSALEIGIMMAGVSVSTAVAAANLGRLAGRFGQPRVLVGGFVIFALALAMIPLAPTLAALAIPAVLLGASFATTIPVVQVLLAEIAPEDRRGAVLSFNGTVLRLGQTLGPPVMAAVERLSGLDAVFFAGSALALLFAGLSAAVIRR